ncbi:MAG: hypothetical protein ACYS8W_17550 [Planctomycetota bacterium]
MSPEVEKKKVLVTVKTYPHPSTSYGELVCTAGVLANGEFIRLYPMPFRYLPEDQRFEKYQWIELWVERNDNDPRPESFRPVLHRAIKPLEKIIKWNQRAQYLFKNELIPMCEFRQHSRKEASLGIIKPANVKRFIIEYSTEDWNSKQKAEMKQMRLDIKRIPLEKIPYKFSYEFTCTHPDCNGHKQMISDWEIGALFRKMREKYEIKDALSKVEEKFFNFICGPEKDIHFFVGTVLEHNTWIVLGTYYPPIEESLFD